MYFHAVKSTAHPPFIGALGHSTDCIVKQSYTFAFVQACCVLVEEKLHFQTIKHTDIRKFKVCPAWLLFWLLSVSVCEDCGWINVSFKNFQRVASTILSKSESPGSPDSADNFEFSAERLSENAKSIKIMLFAELLTVISPSYVQSLQWIVNKTLKHTVFSTKMPHWQLILVIFMISHFCREILSS